MIGSGTRLFWIIVVVGVFSGSVPGAAPLLHVRILLHVLVQADLSLLRLQEQSGEEMSAPGLRRIEGKYATEDVKQTPFGLSMHRELEQNVGAPRLQPHTGGGLGVGEFDVLAIMLEQKEPLSGYFENPSACVQYGVGSDIEKEPTQSADVVQGQLTFVLARLAKQRDGVAGHRLETHKLEFGNKHGTKEAQPASTFASDWPAKGGCPVGGLVGGRTMSQTPTFPV